MKKKLNIAFILDIKQSDIKLSDSLIDDLNFDSLDIVDFMCRLEENFNILIPEITFYSLKTVKNVIDYVEKSKKEKKLCHQENQCRYRI